MSHFPVPTVTQPTIGCAAAAATSPAPGAPPSARGAHVTLTCAGCGRAFACPAAEARHRRYHDRPCYLRHVRRVEVDCLECERTYRVSARRVDPWTGGGMLCSSKCEERWWRRWAAPRRSWRWTCAGLLNVACRPLGFYVAPVARRKGDRMTW
jgi:hypothetical protein